MENAYTHAEKDRAIQAINPDMVEQVFDFNEQCLGIEQRPIGLLSEGELQYALKAIAEEANEFQDAHNDMDVIGAVDAVLDLIYFSLGFLRRMGLTRDQVRSAMTAVHTANMTKKQGAQAKRGGDGVIDAIKPEGWQGPEERIAQILGG
jgi:predicted HAD superfamily Cof-like phosphohydrolase